MSPEPRPPVRNAAAPARGGASTLRIGWRDRLDAVRRHHRLSALDALQRMRRSPFLSLLTALVLAVALSLPAVLYVVIDNLRLLAGGVEGQAQVSLFLKLETTAAAQRELATRIGQRDDVARVQVITREQALEEFRTQSGYADALELVDGNPLPGVIVVLPKQVSGAPALATELAREKTVDSVQLDSAWLQKLTAILAIGERLAQALAFAFVLAVLLVVVNTIRLAVENRRDEVLVSRLVGATDAYVRRPFLYTGLWFGLAGGLLAAGLVAALVYWLGGPVQRLAELYGSTYSLRGLGFTGSLELVLLGALLGVAGAWLAVGRHLRDSETL
ncbi:MAG: permease-like cell division protein FtsX [Pseudomonadota bacterium]